MSENTTFSLKSESQHPFVILKSKKHFRHWFLEKYDFSIFSENEIEDFFYESSPTEFPCIPLYEKETYPTAYISLSFLEHCLSQLEYI